MIVGKDSSFRHLPAALSEEQKLFLDGIRYSVNMADIAHQRLLNTLFSLTTRSLKEDPQKVELAGLIAVAMLDAWCIIDSVNRLRILLEKLPRIRLRIKKHSPPLVIFGKEIMNVKILRDIVQHLDTEIPSLINNRASVWGALSWFALLNQNDKSGYICSLVPGTLSPRTIPVVNPLGKNVSIPIGLITLTAGEHFVCLSDVMISVEKVTMWLEQELKSRFGNLSEVGADIFTRLEIEFGEDKTQAPELQ